MFVVFELEARWESSSFRPVDSVQVTRPQPTRQHLLCLQLVHLSQTSVAHEAAFNLTKATLLVENLGHHWTQVQAAWLDAYFHPPHCLYCFTNMASVSFLSP